MDRSVEALIGMAGLALLALAAFAVYRWRQRERVRRVEWWVKDYLVTRYGGVPQDLHIHCTDDQLWPVLVSFDGPEAGVRRRLSFHCAGSPAAFLLLSEQQESRDKRPPAGLPASAAG